MSNVSGVADSTVLEIHSCPHGHFRELSVTLPKEKIIVLSGQTGRGKSCILDALIRENDYRATLLEQLRQNSFELPTLSSFAGTHVYHLSPTRRIHPVRLSKAQTVYQLFHLEAFFLPLLFLHGVRTCPRCKTALSLDNQEDFLKWVLRELPGILVAVCRSMTEEEKNTLLEGSDSQVLRVFPRIIIDDHVYDLEEPSSLPEVQSVLKQARVSLVIIDRCKVEESRQERLRSALSECRNHATQSCILYRLDDRSGKPLESVGFDSPHDVCPFCGFQLLAISPELFAFDKVSLPQEKSPFRFRGLSSIEPDYRSEIEQLTVSGILLLDLLSLPIEKICTRMASSSSTEPTLSESLQPLVHALSKAGLAHLTLLDEMDQLDCAERVLLATSALLTEKPSGQLLLFDFPFEVLAREGYRRLAELWSELRDLGNTILYTSSSAVPDSIANHQILLGRANEEVFSKALHEGAPKIASQDGPSTQYCSAPGEISQQNFPTCRFRSNVAAHSGSLQFFALNTVSSSSIVSKCQFLFSLLQPALETCARNHLTKFQNEERSFELFLERQISSVKALRLEQPSSRVGSALGTFLGLFPFIQEFFSRLELSRMRGYGPQAFSFSSSKNQLRCKTCKGRGRLDGSCAGVHDEDVLCPQCQGSRFEQEILQVRYKGLSVSDYLDMSVSELQERFPPQRKLSAILSSLDSAGLGRLRLSQELHSLSPGEYQLLRLSRLAAQHSKNSFILLEEPTFGLDQETSLWIMQMLKLKTQEENTVVALSTNSLFLTIVIV